MLIHIRRIFWGRMFDKLGYKTCLLIIGITVTVIIPSLPLLTLLGWCYMPALVNICLYHCHLYLSFRARHINSEFTVGSSDGYSVLHLSRGLSCKLYTFSVISVFVSNFSWLLLCVIQLLGQSITRLILAFSSLHHSSIMVFWSFSHRWVIWNR